MTLSDSLTGALPLPCVTWQAQAKASPEAQGDVLSMFPSHLSDTSRNAYQGGLSAFICPQDLPVIKGTQASTYAVGTRPWLH